MPTRTDPLSGSRRSFSMVVLELTFSPGVYAVPNGSYPWWLGPLQLRPVVIV
jgi:hypothetical protein